MPSTAFPANEATPHAIPPFAAGFAEQAHAACDISAHARTTAGVRTQDKAKRCFSGACSSASPAASGVPSPRPPWIMVHRVSAPTGWVPRAYVRVVEPPCVSDLCLPANLVATNITPDPDSDVTRFLIGVISSASTDGLLFLQVSVFDAPIRHDANQVRQGTGFERGHTPHETARYVCNALTGELSRIPDMYTGGPSSRKIRYLPGMGLLTQADRGHGPPNRFALADIRGNTMLRFLSETGEWDEIAATAPYQVRLERRFCPPSGISDQEPFAFGGRLWWVDLTWGAISADPFSDRPEPQFVELPTGSVLPPRTLPDPMESAENLRRYRRMGVSEGRLCYAEVSEQEPFLLSVFALDEEGSGWTLEYRLLLSQLWADGGHPWLPLPEKTTPQIGALDPLNGDVIYLMMGTLVVGVDMKREKVIGSSPKGGHGSCIPCVLPSWLESSRIPAAGKKDNEENRTLADTLVRSAVTT